MRKLAQTLGAEDNQLIHKRDLATKASVSKGLAKGKTKLKPLNNVVY